MKNMDEMVYTSETKIMAGYRVISMVCREIIVSGMRIALAGELKSIKMLIDPDYCIPEDLELLGILNDPDVQLTHTLVNYIMEEIMPRYGILHLLDDDEVLMNTEVENLAGTLFNRFIFLRKHHRRRDCFINFYKVLHTAQRVLYEWCKLMIAGENNITRKGYRCNYSRGRLKALFAGQAEYHTGVVAELICRLNADELLTSYGKINKKIEK